MSKCVRKEKAAPPGASQEVEKIPSPSKQEKQFRLLVDPESLIKTFGKQELGDDENIKHLTGFENREELSEKLSETYKRKSGGSVVNFGVKPGSKRPSTGYFPKEASFGELVPPPSVH